MLVREQLRAAVEAIMFSRSEPIKAEELAKITEASLYDVETVMAELSEEYNNKERGIRISSGQAGYSMCTDPGYYEYVRRANKPLAVKLSQAAIETLAVIAYRQPITRAEIEAIRGVKADRILQSLLVRELIQEVGKKDVPGRPLMYGTTAEFLKLFGLASLDELPHEPGEAQSI
ncbi:MAG: SMC-Scp complex subunit ScpB [Chitinophagales bacterium]